MTAISRMKTGSRQLLSRWRLRALAAAGRRNGQVCVACKREVPGFTFYSYRPFGCPFCRSSPRERFVFYALESGLITLPEAPLRVLHVAPGERQLTARLRAAGEYLAGDIDPGAHRGGGVVYVDLTRTRFDRGFDLLYASHVLEHIVDDRAAMRNIRELLTPRGLAVILVPIHDARTIDGGPDLSARERERRFGQWNHVRIYGMDIVDRLEAAGLHVDVVDSARLPAEVIARNGFETRTYDGKDYTERIFVCRRSAIA
jgi:SAM-dependent methyltransferase